MPAGADPACLPEAPRVLGLVLAGGLARRMGGRDKTLLHLDTTATLLDVLRARLAPQCAALALSANGDPKRFGSIGLPVLPDPPGPSRGPLAGVLAGLDWAALQAPGSWLLTVPGDTPFVPFGLAERLLASARREEHPVARVVCGDKRHSLVALWFSGLHGPLREALLGRDIRKVTAFQAEVGVAEVAWPGESHDPFFNVNTPEDLTAARALYRVP